MLTPETLTDRLARVRASIMLKQAAARELEAQVNTLIGREAELLELLALMGGAP